MIKSVLIFVAATLDIMLNIHKIPEGYSKWNAKPLAITVITNFMREDTFTKLFLSKLSFNRKKKFKLTFNFFKQAF